MLYINWQAITALVAGFGLMGAIFTFATRSIVRGEIVKLNGTYLRKELADLKFREIETTFDGVDRKFVEVERHFDYLRDRSK